MGPFKIYYNQEVESWMTDHPFKAIMTYQIGELMGKAYAKIATLKNAVNGLSKCEIILFNRNIFDEHEFVPLDEQQVKMKVNLVVQVGSKKQSHCSTCINLQQASLLKGLQ